MGAGSGQGLAGEGGCGSVLGSDAIGEALGEALGWPWPQEALGLCRECAKWGLLVEGGDSDSGGCADGGTFPVPSCRGRGHLGDRRGWDRAVEGVMGWGSTGTMQNVLPTRDGEPLAGMEPGAECARMALGAEDGVRLDDPILFLHLSGG